MENIEFYKATLEVINSWREFIDLKMLYEKATAKNPERTVILRVEKEFGGVEEIVGMARDELKKVAYERIDAYAKMCYDAGLWAVNREFFEKNLHDKQQCDLLKSKFIKNMKKSATPRAICNLLPA